MLPIRVLRHAGWLWSSPMKYSLILHSEAENRTRLSYLKYHCYIFLTYLVENETTQKRFKPILTEFVHIWGTYAKQCTCIVPFNPTRIQWGNALIFILKIIKLRLRKIELTAHGLITGKPWVTEGNLGRPDFTAHILSLCALLCLFQYDDRPYLPPIFKTSGLRQSYQIHPVFINILFLLLQILICQTMILTLSRFWIGLSQLFPSVLQTNIFSITTFTICIFEGWGRFHQCSLV